MFTHTSITNAQSKSLQDALHRIVVSDAVALDLRVAALQGIEDLEMGSAADKMTIRDVHTYTAEWGWAKDRSHAHYSDPTPDA